MDENQFRELKTLILNLAVQVEELKLRIKWHEDAAQQRHEFLAERITQPRIEITSPYPELQKLFDKPGDDQN